MKGTMSHYWLSLTRGKTLIPVPTKGTMPGSFKRVFNYICFNPRTREGYDNIIFASSSYVEYFNPRTHGGYDMQFACISTTFRSFNPRTHGGYDETGCDSQKWDLSFNPRTHGGYDGEII